MILRFMGKYNSVARLYRVIISLKTQTLLIIFFYFLVDPYENFCAHISYLAKQGLPNTDAENGALKHPSAFVCKFAKSLTMVATSCHIESLRASIVQGFLLQAHPFSKPHKMKSGGVKSGDLGHRFLEITWTTKYNFQFPSCLPEMCSMLCCHVESNIQLIHHLFDLQIN